MAMTPPARRGVIDASTAPGVAATDVFVFPTSFAQQRLWFLDQLVPDNAFYNLDSALWMSMTPADVPVLERTLNEIVRRHESLRTTFMAVDGQPVQVVATEGRVSLPVIDLRHLPPAARQAEAQRLATDEARRSFDLAKGPLLRTSLVRVDEAEYAFLVTMHHIVADGWSVGVFWNELTTLWHAFERRQPSPLAELPLQYADYAVWQRNWLEHGVEEHLAYWTRQLADLPTTALPIDWPRPEAQSFMGARHPFWVPRPIHEALRRASQAEGVTLFMTLLAAFQALLARYTGQDDIVVGAPIANRTRAEIEGVIGFFVNSLVLRTDLSGDPPFRVLLRRVRDMALAAYAHQDLPFERLVQEIQPERDLNRHPLFQVSFQLFTSDDQRRASMFEDDLLETEKGTANIDFALDLWEYGDGIYATIEYSTDLFEADTIKRIAGHYLTLLEGIVQSPDARISELPVLTARERRQVIVDWNATASPYDESSCIHHLVEAQVRRTPDGVAVAAPDRTLTYAALNAQANRLARHLRSRGIVAEDLVGVCIDRSADMLVALLAVLKSGAAYLPLDPTHPPDRLAFLLSDARPRLVLTHTRVEARLSHLPVRRIRLDADADLWAAEAASDLPHEVVASDCLAYVMYTSGSTGWPKGVMVTHRAVCNHLVWAQSAIPLDGDDLVAQTYSIGFDASVLEIFGTLAAGARLVVVPPAEHFDAREFVRLLRREEVTAIDVVPSMLRVLLEEPELAQCHALRRVTCGGEALPTALREQFFSVLDAELHNAYGPTEATIGATLWTCRRSDADGPVPIGRPVANTQIYIVDRAMNPVPVGVVGEILIGGHGLARGYLNRPDLTAERFVPDPFSGRPESCLYRSGDRGRYLPDGSIEYVGRVDDQIKLRGIRVEPGEIEACLLRHPSVDACAVVAHEPAPDDPQVVAYVVPAAAAPELWPSIGEYAAYDELAYLAMTHDERRNEAYTRAIERHVAGRTVVDVGTGADAVLARLCVEAGAARVYAIEVLDEACTRARDLVARLHLDDRITVIHGDSRGVDLPERVDVCVSELLGTIGSSEGVGPILNDARRFLKPGGVMIPARAVTRMAAVTLPDALAASPAFAGAARPYVDRIFEHAGGPFDLRVCIRNFPRENVISDAGIFEDLDLRSDVPAEARTVVTLTVRERARMDGVLAWLTVYPAEGEGVDVLDGKTNWLPIFFPVAYPGVEVQPGDVIRAECARSLTHPTHPDYRIAGSIGRPHDACIEFDYRSPYVEHGFQDTPFHRALFATADTGDTGHAVPTESVDHRTLVPALDRYLRTLLPAQMVPAAIVLLNALPVGANGKIDRDALPVLTRLRATAGDPIVPPRNDVEQRLAGIWSEVLKAREVGVHDNFFTRLGGHSLLATQLIARVRDAFEIDLPLRRLFEGPTIAELALAVEETLIDLIEGLSEDSVRRLIEENGGHTAGN
jgi:amino acid adenylation domain-containing protein